MSSSDSEASWNTNCDQVKAAFGGYPDFWRDDILFSGLSKRVLEPKPVLPPGPPNRPSPLSEQGSGFDL